MLQLDPQGLNHHAHHTHTHTDHTQALPNPADYRSRPGSPASVSASASTPRSVSGPRRTMSSSFVNNHQTETSSSPHLPTSVLRRSNSISPLPPRLPIRPRAPTGPLPAIPPPPATTLQPPPLARRNDSGSHVELNSPKLQSPLRYSLNSFDDNTNPIDTLVNTSQVPVSNMAYTGDNKRTRPRVSTTHTEEVASAPTSPTVIENPSRSRLSTWLSRTNTGTSTSTSTTNSTSKPTSPAGLSRFSFFNTGPTTNTSINSQNDELMTLDIERGLFPGGPPVDGSAFSPASFKNLQMNATGLLDKFQSAYQQRAIEYQDLKTDRDSLLIEKSQAEKRMQHMEKQMEEHGRKAEERDAFIESLLKELALEVSRRPSDGANESKQVSPSSASTISEDLGVDEDRQRGHWRKSTSTSKSEETDEESMDGASVFSQSRSPTLGTSVFEASPVATPTPQTKPAMLELPKTPVAKISAPQMTAFQKLFKTMGNETSKNTSVVAASCSNCQGQASSVAWDTVDLLKGENKGLKLRVEELESAVEGALDVVNGLVL